MWGAGQRHNTKTVVEKADAVVIEQMEFFPRWSRLNLADAINVASNAAWVLSLGSEKAKRLKEPLKQITTMAEHYETIFEKRNFGGILDPAHQLTEKEKEDKVPQRGSIPYLLVESHSTSRRELRTEVKNFLEKVGPKK